MEYSAMKKNEIMPFVVTWMDLDYHTKWSKPERKRQILYITYMWNLKYDTDELIYETQTDSQTKNADLWLPKGKGGGGGIN